MPDTEERPSRSINWRKVALGTFSIAALLFLVSLTYSEREHISELFRNSNQAWLIVSTMILMFSNLSLSLIFANAIRHSGRANSSILEICGAFLFSQLGKYVPGRVWPIVLQRLLGQKETPLYGTLLANAEVAIAGSSTLAGLAVTFVIWARLGLPAGLLTMASTMVFSYLLVRVRLTSKIANYAVTLVRRSATNNHNSRLSHTIEGQGLLTALGTVGFVTFYSAGWLCLGTLGLRLPFPTVLGVVAALSLSQVVGVLSLLPAGIGAREVSFIALTAYFGVTSSTAAALAIATRLVLIAIDAFGSVLGAFLFLLGRSSEQ